MEQRFSIFVWHQMLGWRGMRDLAVIWKEIGRKDLYDRYYPVAQGLRKAIAEAMEASQKEMPDGTLFIPRMMLEDAPIEAPVTETRLGSYWNLCMPYAFTFVSGEGETVGERPGEFYRSCYGTPCSANNNAFLLPLRLMLVRESFDRDTGLPESLYLAHATPREWLEDGKTLRVENAPTCFGPVSYQIESRLARNTIEASINLPDRNPAKSMQMKIRVPRGYAMDSVRINGEPHSRFDSVTEVIDLSGLEGRIDVTITYKQS